MLDPQLGLMMRHRLRIGVTVLALACGGWGGALLARTAYLDVKARLAGVLIERAFAAYLGDGAPHRPWSWADTHPVARLWFPRLGIRRVVLDGAGGPVLAFGPGRVHGSGEVNGAGNCVIAGHRDSWFAFLEQLRIGDRLLLETREGQRVWIVESLQVVSMWDPRPAERLVSQPRLTLLTCWPFRALRPGAARYVVRCRPDREPEPGFPARPDRLS